MNRVRLLDAEEAAWYLGKTSRWVRAQVQARRIPFVRVGRSVRFRIEDLDRYIGENVVPKDSDA